MAVKQSKVAMPLAILAKVRSGAINGHLHCELYKGKLIQKNFNGKHNSASPKDDLPLTVYHSWLLWLQTCAFFTELAKQLGSKPHSFPASLRDLKGRGNPGLHLLYQNFIFPSNVFWIATLHCVSLAMTWKEALPSAMCLARNGEYYTQECAVAFSTDQLREVA